MESMGVQQTLRFGPDLCGSLGVTAVVERGKSEGSLLGQSTPGRKLRGYQVRIATEALKLLDAYGSCLVPMATGTGKTTVAYEVIREYIRRQRRVLWLVHREELVYQAYHTLKDIAVCQMEMRAFRVDGDAEIVVASKDTLRHRLEKFPRDYFGLIVTDETHHGIARTYRRIYDYFGADGTRCHHLGLTATPDRSDGLALGVQGIDGTDLGGIFKANTRPFTIHDGIRSGWLVPFSVLRIVLGDVDTSTVKVVAGDFSQSDLSRVLTAESPLLAAANALLWRCGDRPTIGFCASVSHAERLAEILNRFRPDCARVVTGETDRAIRAAMFREFGTRYQFLLNYGVATEGTDLPICRCVAMLRPTKSRLVWTQSAGRGTRPLKGIDDAEDSDGARKAWIASSGKPDCLLLDFVGAVGRHSLVGPMDVLGGEASAAVQEIAATLSETSPVDVYEALKKAQDIDEERQKKAAEEAERKRLAMVARRAAIKARAEHRARMLDPLQLMRASGADVAGSTFDGPTPGQVDEAVKLKLIFPEDCTKRDAAGLLLHEKNRRAQGLASCATVRFIKQLYPRMSENMILLLSQKEAGKMIARAKGWMK